MMISCMLWAQTSHKCHTETYLLVAAQIFPTAQIFLELKFILEIQIKIAKQRSI